MIGYVTHSKPARGKIEMSFVIQHPRAIAFLRWGVFFLVLAARPAFAESRALVVVKETCTEFVNHAKVCAVLKGPGQDEIWYHSSDGERTQLGAGSLQLFGSYPGEPPLELPRRVGTVREIHAEKDMPPLRIGTVVGLDGRMLLILKDGSAAQLPVPPDLVRGHGITQFHVDALPDLDDRVEDGGQFTEVELYQPSKDSPKKGEALRFIVQEPEMKVASLGAHEVARPGAEDEFEKIKHSVIGYSPEGPAQVGIFADGKRYELNLSTMAVTSGEAGSGPARSQAPSGLKRVPAVNGAVPDPTSAALAIPGEELLARVDRIEPEIEKGVIGSESLGPRIAAIFRNSVIKDGEMPKVPITFIAPAESGNDGPEELARAIASSRYGDPTHVEEISLASVTGHDTENAIWGAQQGYKDSEKTGAFEAAVRKLMKTGGVLLIRDTQAVGSAERENAEGFRHSFLEKLAETIRSGQLYSVSEKDEEKRNLNLRRITFLITGREADELYLGTVSDGRKMELFEESRAPEKVRDLLHREGYPSKLLDLTLEPILFSPRTADVLRPKIDRVLEEEFAHYSSKYGVKIAYDKDLTDRLLELIYSSDTGMPGLRNFIRKVSGQLIDPEIAALLRSGKGSIDKTIRLSLHESRDGGKRKVTLSATFNRDGKKQIVPLDVTSSAASGKLLALDDPHPTRNPLLMERMLQLEDRVSHQLIGQAEMVKDVARAVRGMVMNKASKLGLFFINVGPTGAGKSEAPKALARAIWGDDWKSHFDSIAMGDYQTSIDGLFGTEYKKGIFETKLEKLLKAGGGIMTLDEFSNLGGNNPELKNAFMKRFYDIKGEGYWVSPYGKHTRYYTGNIVWWATGNDGESLFKDQNDDMRGAIYREFKERGKLQSYLVEKGFPEALLGRADGVFLSEPQSVDQVSEITGEKFLRPVLETFRKEYPKLEIRESPEFVRQLVRTFKNSGQGARALQTVVNNKVGGDIGEALMRYHDEINRGEKVVLELGLADNLGSRPYVTPANHPRKVILTTKYEVGGHRGEVRTDLTYAAPSVERLTTRDALMVAYHEAGHGASHDPSVSGKDLEFINIQPHGKAAGYARYAQWEGIAHMGSRADFIRSVAQLMAGQMAVVKAGFPKNPGWSSDIAQLRKLTYQYLIRGAMHGKLVSLSVDSEGNPVLSGADANECRHEADRLLAEAFDLSQKSLNENWSFVRDIAALLVKKGTVTRAEYEALRERERREPGSSRMAPQAASMEDLIGIPDRGVRPAPKKGTAKATRVARAKRGDSPRRCSLNVLKASLESR